MKRRLIITDLTRFSEKIDKVCMAGIDVSTNECIRPMPYLTKEDCVKYKILPGSIIEGDFERFDDLEPPHIEDCRHKNLTQNGPCSSNEFLQILIGTAVASIEKGFGVPLVLREKYIEPKLAHKISASIITIEIAPKNLLLVENRYKPGEIKVHIKDNSGLCLHFLSLTDLGYYNFIKSQKDLSKALITENNFIQSQDRVFLRVGLGRLYKSGEKEGFWVQINGIYTFPSFNSEIRSYK